MRHKHVPALQSSVPTFPTPPSNCWYPSRLGRLRPPQPITARARIELGHLDRASVPSSISSESTSIAICVHPIDISTRSFLSRSPICPSGRVLALHICLPRHSSVEKSSSPATRDFSSSTALESRTVSCPWSSL
ncbi:hypothetical protein NUW54_g10220 [Trametes sanguinea]|uniref:Uncharacterized protein n=1 Tax=Trametes sanguinea TaxID=158606 RepID=A0ACC1P268_9APHY|nr:hypothetical protein NUW54_g10220 [Trametes sanguinea]